MPPVQSQYLDLKMNLKKQLFGMQQGSCGFSYIFNKV